MDKKEAFAEINRLQDEYVAELIRLMKSPDYAAMKCINFTSATGTGKTKMMSKLINQFLDYFFVVTTLSKGQLHIQIRNELSKDCITDNFYVYGSADYKINSKLDAEDIIGMIPIGTKCIWLRDEGHIATNRWDELLQERCEKVVNFSATNTHNDILCNFTQTMMLRTVNQSTGTPEDAINKLLEIKEAHKNVPDYNPCAIFRCVDSWKQTCERVIKLCEDHNLKYINITDDSFVMSELCEDNNEYDVIINKFKIVEGIDIRRAHVIYMDNQPKNTATTIQAIGRCRRNALLYRNDIDILAPGNEELLKNTRECYVFYNVDSMKIDTDKTGELVMAFCNHISCENLKTNSTISVIDGQLPNGLYVTELEGETGFFNIIADKDTGFNIIDPLTKFYESAQETTSRYIYRYEEKIRKQDVLKLPVLKKGVIPYIWDLKQYNWKEGEPYYCICTKYYRNNLRLSKARYDLSPLLNAFLIQKEQYSASEILRRLSDSPNIIFLDNIEDTYLSISPQNEINHCVSTYIKNNAKGKGLSYFCELLEEIEDYSVQYNGKTIVLNKLFDKYSLLLIKYCLIERKNRLETNDTIRYTLQSFLSTIQRLLPFKRRINWHAVIYFKLHPDYNFSIFDSFWCPLKLTGKTAFNEPYVVDANSVCEYFNELENLIFSRGNNIAYVNYNIVIDPIIKQLNKTEKHLKNNILDCLQISYESLFEPLSQEESYLIRKRYIKYGNAIPQKELNNGYKEYIRITNDKESAIIGTDLMRQIRSDDNTIIWTESKTVTSKVGNYNKLNSFISRKYAEELSQAVPQCFSGKNAFEFNTRCNSMIGYCVEYYSKYLVYGENYLYQNIRQALNEKHKSLVLSKRLDGFDDNIKLFRANGLLDCLIVRACMLKYKEMMVHCFGYGAGRVISSIPLDELVKTQYQSFVKLIVYLGIKTAAYIKKELYRDTIPCNDIDPNLSINHISGLADYITEDTILDVKVRNNIDENCIRQVLAYHYLSTKRSDLHIKRVIVYDATSDRAIKINISNENLK